MVNRYGQLEDGVRLFKGKDWVLKDIKGYWSVIREGDDWNIRMLTSNLTPEPTK